jgi:hypothetical protein
MKVVGGVLQFQVGAFNGRLGIGNVSLGLLDRGAPACARPASALDALALATSTPLVFASMMRRSSPISPSSASCSDFARARAYA